MDAEEGCPFLEKSPEQDLCDMVNMLFDDWKNSATSHLSRKIAATREPEPFDNAETNQIINVLSAPLPYLNELDRIIIEKCQEFRDCRDIQELDAIVEWVNSNSSTWIQAPIMLALPEIYDWVEKKVEKLSNNSTLILFTLIMVSAIKMQRDDAHFGKDIKTALETLNESSAKTGTALKLTITEDSSTNLTTLMEHFRTISNNHEISIFMQRSEAIFQDAFKAITPEVKKSIFTTPTGKELKINAPGAWHGIYPLNMFNTFLVTIQGIGLIGKGGTPLLEKANQLNCSRNISWLQGNLPTRFLEKHIFPRELGRFPSTGKGLRSNNLYQPDGHYDRCRDCFSSCSRLPNQLHGGALDCCHRCTIAAKSKCCNSIKCYNKCQNSCERNCGVISRNICNKALCTLCQPVWCCGCCTWWVSHALCSHCTKCFPKRPHSIEEAELDAIELPLLKFIGIMYKQLYYDCPKGFIDCIQFSKYAIQAGLYTLGTDYGYATLPKAAFADEQRAQFALRAFEDAIATYAATNGEYLDPYNKEAIIDLYGLSGKHLTRNATIQKCKEPKSRCYSKPCCICLKRPHCSLNNKDSARCHKACFYCLETATCSCFLTNCKHFVYEPVKDTLKTSNQSCMECTTGVLKDFCCCGGGEEEQLTQETYNSWDLSDSFDKKLTLSLAKEPGSLNKDTAVMHLLKLKRKAANKVFPFTQQNSALCCGWSTAACDCIDSCKCSDLCKTGCTKLYLTGCMKAADNFSLPEAVSASARERGLRMDSEELLRERDAGTIKDVFTGGLYRLMVTTGNKAGQAFFSGGDLLDTNAKEDYVSTGVKASTASHLPAMLNFSRHQVSLATQEHLNTLLESIHRDNTATPIIPNFRPDFMTSVGTQLLKRAGILVELGIDKLGIISEGGRL